MKVQKNKQNQTKLLSSYALARFLSGTALGVVTILGFGWLLIRDFCVSTDCIEVSQNNDLPAGLLFFGSVIALWAVYIYGIRKRKLILLFVPVILLSVSYLYIFLNS